jgi:hypothetical protein
MTLGSGISLETIETFIELSTLDVLSELSFYFFLISANFSANFLFSNIFSFSISSFSVNF